MSYKGTSQSITTVVQDTTAPATPSGCGDAATQLVWVGQPSNGLAGSALYPSPTVVLEDNSGCVETSDASAVHLSIYSYTPPSGSGLSEGTLSNCVANLGQGETSFTDCSLNNPGTYQLVATDPTDGAGGLTSLPGNAFTISVGVPAKLVFHEEPGNGTGGEPLSPNPTVWIEDSSGNVIAGDDNPITLAIGTNPSNGTLSGCTASTVSGVATFTTCAINKMGNGYTLVATDPGDNLTTPLSSSAFDVTPGPPAQLAFTTEPSTSDLTGDAFQTQPVVTIEDAGGNAVTSDTSTATMKLTAGTGTGGATLSGCTATSNGKGVVTFTGCAVSPAGSNYTLTATVTNDEVNGATFSGVSSPFNVAAGTDVVLRRTLHHHPNGRNRVHRDDHGPGPVWRRISRD